MMEYTLKVTVSPTIHKETVAARIFIAIDEDDRHVETVQVWEASLYALDPAETADPNLWALAVLREITERLGTDAMTQHITGQAKTMLSLTEPKQPFLL